MSEGNGTVVLKESDTERLENQLVATIGILEERIAELEFAQEDVGWDRVNANDSKYEFTKEHLNKIVSRSRIFYLHNPLINRAVSLQSDYVFAQGINIEATNDAVNEVIQAFIDDPQNMREITGHQARLMKEQTLMLDGNVFLVLFTDVMSGTVQVRSVLVEEITEIITNPDDSNEIWYYQREWTSRTYKNGTYTTKNNKVLYPDIDYRASIAVKSRTSYEGIQVQWNAPIYHVKVGGLSKSRYGVPEVYAALDWAKAHRTFLEDWATIVRSYARFAWQLKVPGGKNAVVAAKTKLASTVNSTAVIEKNPPPIPGSIFTTGKDGATIDPIKTAGATTNAQDGREIRMMVAAALGIPDTFFGDVDVGNLATARTLDRPTELKFRSRQTMWQQVYQKILAYVIKWAILAPRGKLVGKAQLSIGKDGNLVVQSIREVSPVDKSSGDNNTKKDKSKNDSRVEVTFPPILEHSIKDRIDAIAAAVTLNGRAFAVDSPELAKITIRLMLQALGMTDVDELTNGIFADIDDMDSMLGKVADNPNDDDPEADKIKNDGKPKDGKPEQKDDDR